MFAGSATIGASARTHVAVVAANGHLHVMLARDQVVGWVKATPTVSETGRQVREYRITPSGSKQLDAERQNFHRLSRAITTVLDTA